MKEINPADLERSQVYKLLTGSIVPRAIAWVSSMSADGTRNLAPFSYFTAVSANPPLVLFCPGTRGTDGGNKDTYHNVKATGEFVINFVNAANAEAMNITATELPAAVDEFEYAGLTPILSKHVNVPRVQESPIHFECKLHQIVDAGDGHIVIGEVLYMHFDEAVFKEGNYIDVAALQPIARLAGPNYAHLSDFFQLNRAPSEVK
ncbi:MAG: flavin reductase family protein [Anaerolineae bacterium]|nr:flavin reductase family protein [Anaerolineae bacterium]MDQ7035067.1 flavin reductase family protein [Anaerolineae bacterium]